MDSALRKELKSIEKKKLQARNARDIAEEAKLCNNAGELLAEHRLFEEAIEEHKMELQLSEAINDTMGIAISHRKVGECLCECQDFETALIHQQKYLDLSKQANNLVEKQRAYATIGRTWFQCAKSSSGMMKAQAAFLESLSICDQLRETVKEKELLEMRARLYLNLGLVYEKLNSKTKGIKYIEKALAIAVNQSLKDTEYRCYFSLGDIKISEGRPAEALQCFERARKVAQHQKKKFDEADTLVQMGQVLLSLGDFKGGKRILKGCLKTMQHGNYVNELRISLVRAIKGTNLLEKLQKCSKKNDVLIKNYEDLGDIFTQVKCYSQAIFYYHKQLELSEHLKKSKEEKAVICYSLAYSYGDIKQYVKAKEYYYKELELRDGDFNEQAETWCKIAQMSETAGEEYENVRKAYRSGIECAKLAQKPAKQIHLLRLLAEAQKNFSQKKDLQETLIEISSLEECKMEDDSEAPEDDEESEGEEEDDGDKQLLEEEMNVSDQESDDDEEGEKFAVSKAKRTKAKSVNKRNEKGETILHCAAIRGDYILAKSSIEKGVSVHSRDYCGWQPLHEACNHGHIGIVKLLLDHGADVNDQGGPHCSGMTPLHDATQNGHVDVVKLLVNRGALVTMKNKDGQTALDQVLCAISAAQSDPDDIDSPDYEHSEIREQLKDILTNATGPTRPRTTQLLEMKRRDQLDFSESDEEPTPDISETNSNSQNSKTFSRKRKNVLGFDSDDESDEVEHSQAKASKISENSESGNTPENGRIGQFGEEFWEGSDDVIDDDRGSGVNFMASGDEALSDLSQDHPFSISSIEPPIQPLSQDEATPNKPGRSPTSGNNMVLADISMKHRDHFSTNPTQEIENPRNPSKAFYDRSKTYKTQTKFNDFSDRPNKKTFSHRPFAPRHHMLLEQNSKNFEAPIKIHSSVDRHTEKEPRNLTPSLPKRNSLMQGSSKNSNSLTKFLDPYSGSTEKESQSSDTPALIPENEYLDGNDATDGWLINDIPRSGKRKRSSDIRSMFRTEGEKNLLAAEKGASSRPRPPKRSQLRQSRLNNHVVDSRSIGVDDWDNEGSVSVDPASSRIPFAFGTTKVDVSISAPMRLRVKVKEKTFLIPCPETSGEKKTVGWLAEQATFRYYSACGLKPVLVLSTAEGAVLSPDDNITDVLSNNEEVIASIENWDLPPLVERYKAACLSTNTVVYQPILQILQSNVQLSNADFPDMALTPVKVLPLFRALQCHDQLVTLSLPGNRIGDTGFQHLIAALPCFPNLAIIILSCNNISHKGLRHLASALSDDTQTSRIWMGLKELDISFNPIKDIGTGSLATILRSCLLIQKLNLQSCCLTRSTFQPRSVLTEAIIGLTRLHQFNISHNIMSFDCLRYLLNALTSSSVQVLDISYTIERYDSSFAKFLADYLNTDICCVKELICQGCFLKDVDIQLLVSSQCFLKNIVKLDLSLNEIGYPGCSELAIALQSSHCPKHLNLSGNLNINNDNLAQFLTPSITKSIQHLDMSVCGLTSPLPIEFKNLQTGNRILQFLNLSHNSINRTDQETLSDWWKAVWGSQSKIILQHPYIIFTRND